MPPRVRHGSAPQLPKGKSGNQRYQGAATVDKLQTETFNTRKDSRTIYLTPVIPQMRKQGQEFLNNSTEV